MTGPAPRAGRRHRCRRLGVSRPSRPSSTGRLQRDRSARAWWLSKRLTVVERRHRRGRHSPTAPGGVGSGRRRASRPAAADDAGRASIGALSSTDIASRPPRGTPGRAAARRPRRGRRHPGRTPGKPTTSARAHSTQASTRVLHEADPPTTSAQTRPRRTASAKGRLTGPDFSASSCACRPLQRPTSAGIPGGPGIPAGLGEQRSPREIGRKIGVAIHMIRTRYHLETRTRSSEVVSHAGRLQPVDGVPTVAAAIPDQEVLVWRDRRFTYAELRPRGSTVSRTTSSARPGQSHRARRAGRPRVRPGHLGLYLRNGNEYLEAMIAGYRPAWRRSTSATATSRRNSSTCSPTHGPGAGLPRRVRPAGRRDPRPAARPPGADPGRRRVRHALLPGAVDYETILHTAAPPAGCPSPRRRPLHPLHRRHHRHAQGRAVAPGRHLRHVDGRPAVRHHDPFTSYEEIAEAARDAGGGMRMLMIPPFMHGAAQWSAFNMVTSGGRIVLPDDVQHSTRRRAADRRPRERREHPGRRRRDGPAADRRDRDRRLRPLRPRRDQQRRRAADARRPRPHPRRAAAHPDDGRRGSSETGLQMSRCR